MGTHYFLCLIIGDLYCSGSFCEELLGCSQRLSLGLPAALNIWEQGSEDRDVRSQSEGSVPQWVRQDIAKQLGWFWLCRTYEERFGALFAPGLTATGAGYPTNSTWKTDGI